MNVEVLRFLHGLDPHVRPCRSCGVAIEKNAHDYRCAYCRSRQDKRRKRLRKIRARAAA